MYEKPRELSLEELEQVTGGVDFMLRQKDMLDQISSSAENFSIPNGAIDITEFLSNY